MIRIDENKRLKEQLELAAKNIEITDNKVVNLVDAEAIRVLTDWKLIKPSGVKLSEFDTAENLILVTARGFANATILVGDGGLGKTYLTLDTIKSNFEPEDWDYKSGFTTPLALYKYLYHNRTRKVLVLDDVEGLFEDHKSINLLKCATWDVGGQRLIQYDTTSEKANDVPRDFILTTKLVILANKIPNEDDINVSALLSRAIKYEVNFSHKVKLEIIKKVLDKRDGIDDSQRQLCYEIITKNTTEATRNFNLRTMERLISFLKYKPEKAEALFKETLEVDENKEAYLAAVKSSKVVNEQVAKFIELSGKCRKTFYNIKKKCK